MTDKVEEVLNRLDGKELVGVVTRVFSRRPGFDLVYLRGVDEKPSVMQVEAGRFEVGDQVWGERIDLGEYFRIQKEKK